MTLGSLSANGWGCVPVLLVVWHGVSSTGACWPLGGAALTPSCLDREQMPESSLHAEAGSEPKLNPKSCVNKEEKGKFLRAASGEVD